MVDDVFAVRATATLAATRKASEKKKHWHAETPRFFRSLMLNLIFPHRVRQTSLRFGYEWQVSLRPVVAAVPAALWNAGDTPTTARNVAQSCVRIAVQYWTLDVRR